ncbi:MAG: phosphoglycerate mutase, partial [Chloroflexi bacterium]|nr:phosphoglycerate mutase [Chloroflexota bacterium]
VETAEAVARQQKPELTLQIDEGVGEVNFGDWQGKSLRQLSRRRLWETVQHYPSGARFPNGESIREMQFRVVSALESIASRHPSGRVAVVAHSDVIKAMLAHYAGMPLDMFQRLIVSPASISIVQLTRQRPFIVTMNDTSHYTRPRPTEES